jgi:hypothetical protein
VAPLYLLRCTRPLLQDAARHLTTAAHGAVSDTRLGDWFMTRLNCGRQRYLLATSSRSLLSVVVPARDLRGVPDRMARAVGELLAELGIPSEPLQREVAAMKRAAVAPTNDRSVLAFMTNLRVDADWELHDLAWRPGRTLHYVNVRLSETPCGLLAFETPAELTRRLLT